MTDTALAQLALLRAVLNDVLVDLPFPARRWEIVTAAETYRADHRVRSALRTLQAPGYRQPGCTDIGRVPASCGPRRGAAGKGLKGQIRGSDLPGDQGGLGHGALLVGV